MTQMQCVIEALNGVLIRDTCTLCRLIIPNAILTFLTARTLQIIRQNNIQVSVFLIIS